MRCGLRVGDASKIAFDCVVRGGDDALYLRYTNRKMKREALVPIDEEVEHAIAEQQQRILRRWPHGSPWLFPASEDEPRRTQALVHALLPRPVARLAGPLQRPRRIRPARAPHLRADNTRHISAAAPGNATSSPEPRRSEPCGPSTLTAAPSNSEPSPRQLQYPDPGSTPNPTCAPRSTGSAPGTAGHSHHQCRLLSAPLTHPCCAGWIPRNSVSGS